jgi:hypothetical protein
MPSLLQAVQAELREEGQIARYAKRLKKKSAREEIRRANSEYRTPTVWKMSSNYPVQSIPQSKPKIVCSKCWYELETGIPRKGRHSTACPLFGEEMKRK